jgi:hypothetical protein
MVNIRLVKSIVGISITMIFCLSVFISSVFAEDSDKVGSAKSSVSTGTFLYGLKCDNTGTLKFFQKPLTSPVQVVSKKSGKVMEVPGSWKGTTFTSDEMVFVDAGEYEVVDGKNGNKKVNCPGLEFSCKQAVLDVQKCVRKGKKVEVYFTADNVDVGDLIFEFADEGGQDNLLRYGANGFLTELKKLQIRSLTPIGRYVLEVENLERVVNQVQISHPNCVGEHYVYSKGKCVANEEVVSEKEKKGKELKCNGYLNVNDRVSCRLKLKREERELEENSYPEECRGRSDKEKCLKSYEALKPCGKFETVQERVECAREKVDISSIAGRRKYCAGLKYDDKENCEQRLREKVYSLVKFRFSALENMAEKLLDKKQLSADNVSAFELRVERLKLDFNNANSAAERKEVISKVREEWNILMESAKQ